MSDLNYNSLYQIIKYQYDKVKAERLAKMSDAEKRRRAQMDTAANIYNNPSLSNLGKAGMEMIKPPPPKEREKDDPSSYLYNSRSERI